jgi:hypothetical protein
LPSKVRLRFGAPFEVDPSAADDKTVAWSETKRLENLTADLLDELIWRPDTVNNEGQDSQCPLRMSEDH